LTITTGTIADVRVGEMFTWGIYALGGLPPYAVEINPASALPDGAALISGVNPHFYIARDTDWALLRISPARGLDIPFNLRLVDSSGPNTYESRADIDVLEGRTPAALFINGGDAGSFRRVMCSRGM
jgi:hypothetical protein